MWEGIELIKYRPSKLQRQIKEHLLSFMLAFHMLPGESYVCGSCWVTTKKM